MSKKAKHHVLNDFTIQTLREDIIPETTAILTDSAIEMLQWGCYGAVRVLETSPDDVAKIRKFIKAYEDLSEKDQEMIATNFDESYNFIHEAQISVLHKLYQSHIEKITNTKPNWGTEIFDEKMKVVVTDTENWYFNDSIDIQPTPANKFKRTLWPEKMAHLYPAETQSKKPPSTIKPIREYLFLALYRTYKHDLKLKPMETEGGNFWRFLETIITDPAMEIFEVKDLRKEIRKAKILYEKTPYLQ